MRGIVLPVNSVLFNCQGFCNEMGFRVLYGSGDLSVDVVTYSVFLIVLDTRLKTMSITCKIAALGFFCSSISVALFDIQESLGTQHIVSVEFLPLILHSS